MITQGDLMEVTYDMCRQFNVDTYMGEMFPDGEISTERIVIMGGRIVDGSRWDRSPIRVNWVVPDIDHHPDLIRLKAVEHLLKGAFTRGAGKVGTDVYRYVRESLETVTSEGMKVHYVNLTIKFEIINTN